MGKEMDERKYSPDKKGLLLKYGGMAATGVIAGGGLVSLAGCARHEQWAETSGKAGQINLEAVEEAMKKSKDVSEFERRVNEIYQGEEMILIEVRNVGAGEQAISGFADLNNNLEIDSEDEKLFTFRRWTDERGDRRYEMRGYGINSYYYRPYSPAYDLLYTWLLLDVLTRPRYTMMPVYRTPMPETQRIREYRTTYRRTPDYRNQTRANRKYQAKMSARHGTAYRRASPSANRQRWATRKGVNLRKATSISKSASSRSASRSSWGGRRGWGGFRGGGR